VSIGKWSSPYYFFAATIGTAIGLANIWKFTYVAGANGGGAFVVVYVLALAFVSVPALTAEMLVGRRGGGSVLGSIDALIARDGISRHWRLYAVVAVTGVFLVLSFYCVIAGWTIDYLVLSLARGFRGAGAEQAAATYEAMLADPLRIMAYQVLFLAATAGVVSLGLHAGVERAVGVLTPVLFLLVLALLGYSAVQADFARGAAFLLQPDFSRLDAGAVLSAVGQAFFSLGVGLGVMMTLGAYMERAIPMLQATAIIGIADGLCAILAGLAIFPIVFATGLSPAEGPGLIFLTLPVAFGQMPGGAVVAPLFFALLVCAALSSTITLFETVVVFLAERTGIARRPLAAAVAAALWVAGLATVLSFNLLSEFRPLGPLADKTLFELIDYLASNILMPLGGIAVSVLAGWLLSGAAQGEELRPAAAGLVRWWRFSVRYCVPAAVGVLFLVGLA